MTDEPAAPSELYQIPDESIAKWLALPVDAPLVLPITRDDIDNLFFAVRGLAYSHANLLNALAEESAGDHDAARRYLETARGQDIESVNRLSKMMNAFMLAAGIVK